MTNEQFEQIECLSKKLWEDINNGHEYSMVRYTEFLGIVTEVWERLQEEPVSEDLDNMASQLAQKYFPDENNIWARPNIEAHDCKNACIEMAMWQKEHLWKPADGDDLPEYDREVIVLINYDAQLNIHDEEYPTYRVGFGHRPNHNGWGGDSHDKAVEEAIWYCINNLI